MGSIATRNHMTPMVHRHRIASRRSRTKRPITSNTSVLRNDSPVIESQPEKRKISLGPWARFLEPVPHLLAAHRQRLCGYLRCGLLQAVTRDCLPMTPVALQHIYALVNQYRLRFERLWTHY